MESYGQYCPIARCSEVFTTSWTSLIVCNMLLGARTSTEIREGVPAFSKTLLADRLRALEYNGVIERTPIGESRTVYDLTECGRGLGPVCEALGRWGEQWIDLAPRHFVSHIVLESLAKQLTPDDLPDRQTAIRFELGGRPRERIWLLCALGRAEVCARPPLPEDALVLDTRPEWLARWHMGELSIGEGLHRGVMTTAGPQRLVRMLGRWGGLGSLKDRGLAEAAAAVAR